MPFGLTIGTERAIALQQSIQDELTKRGYSPDADPVMAEYITIMIINNKTSAQITSELEDLIGSDFDNSFTAWLFTEAAKGASGPNSPSQPPPPDQSDSLTTQSDPSRRPNNPRAGLPLHHQAILQAQAAPSASSSHKRSASARSLSPGHPNKSRRTDLPTGPRAMLRDGNAGPGGPQTQVNSRSLIERVGGPMRNGAPNGFPRDDIQARIDTITNNNSADPGMLLNGAGAVFPGGMDMGAALGLTNPLVLQEMMMNQMAMMAQMASSMGMLHPPQGQFNGPGPGFPMQGVVPGDRGMFQGGMNGFPGPPQQQQMGMNNGSARGRGVGRGPRGGVNRGRGGQPTPAPKTPEDGASSSTPAPSTIVAPTPIPAVPVPAPASAPAVSSQARLGYVPPERPMSPTLCKFGLKCTNALCRYSHPSPVATAESGVVLSNEACEKGKDCTDKDCIRAHVSPAVLTTLPSDLPSPSTAIPSQPPLSSTTVPCRFGATCARANCPYTHPAPHKGTSHSNATHQSHGHFAQQCRFGASCTRSTCPFQHPEGRVLPTAFHRGLSTAAPIVNVLTPEVGSMGPSPHRSVTFNNAGLGAGGMRALERQVREIEEKKSEAERKVKEAEAGKKDGAAPVAIAA